MKIIFSRKGVDSAAGRCCSPLIDGRPFSLPIPTTMPSPTRYGDLRISAVLSDLSDGRLCQTQPCHLDPDIDRDALNMQRPEGWRGALGQVSSSLSHLRNNNVGPGDLFLFWGLFRDCMQTADGWRYTGPKRHAIFGWLQVETVLELGCDGSLVLAQYPWLSQHPHARAGWTNKNAIYLANETLTIGNGDIPGYGLLRRPLILTEEGASSSTWTVPNWLDPLSGGVGMTYNPPNRWLGNGRVRVASRGQEFVANAGDRPDARAWLLSLLEGNL